MSTLLEWKKSKEGTFKRNAYIGLKQDLTWVIKSPNTHLIASGPIWDVRDMTWVIRVSLDTLEKKWNYLKWRCDFRNLIVLGHIWEQELLFVVKILWLEWFESPKVHLTSWEYFWVEMTLLWLDWNESIKFEGKRVHWRLKRCYSNASSCNDTFRDKWCFWVRLECLGASMDVFGVI